jgi:peroxiredoxin Q/BCP
MSSSLKPKRQSSVQTNRKGTTKKIAEGDEAPDFILKDDSGKDVRLSQLRGKKIVLYFYPKDNTPGCTKEACSFRDGFTEIQSRGAIVIGVSTDSIESHVRFKQKYNLNFPLLSDTDKKVVSKYGVWKEKSLYGRKFMGIERTTFVIDENGKVKKIFPKVKVDGHFEEVLAEL